MKGLTALAAGLLFGLGLALSGMTQPAKVVGFLDLFGHWDPSLLFVMIGAIGFYLPVHRLVLVRPAPLFAEHFFLPQKQGIDRRLLLGALLFGVGWGLSGYCPGPALTSLGAGSGKALLFAFAMLAGMGVFSAWQKRLER